MSAEVVVPLPYVPRHRDNSRVPLLGDVPDYESKAAHESHVHRAPCPACQPWSYSKHAATHRKAVPSWLP
jgi:hypothetical protein